MCDRMHDSIVSIIDLFTFLEQCPRLEPFSSGPGRARHRTWRFGRVVCSNGRAPVPDASAVPPRSRHGISTATAQAHVGTGFARRTARGALTYRAGSVSCDRRRLSPAYIRSQRSGRVCNVF